MSDNAVGKGAYGWVKEKIFVVARLLSSASTVNLFQITTYTYSAEK